MFSARMKAIGGSSSFFGCGASVFRGAAEGAACVGGVGWAGVADGAGEADGGRGDGAGCIGWAGAGEGMG